MSTILREVSMSSVRRRLGAASDPTPQVVAHVDLAPASVADEPAGEAFDSPEEIRARALLSDSPATIEVLDSVFAVQAPASVVAQPQITGASEAEVATARREGYDEGRLDAIEEAQTQWREQALRINALGAAFAGAQQTMIAQAEDDLVALTFEALCNILGETACTRDGVRSIVLRLLARLPEASGAIVRLHPADAALFEQAMADHPDPLAAQLQIVLDSDLTMGGCVVDARGATLEARLDWQIAHLRSLLLDVRAMRRDSM